MVARRYRQRSRRIFADEITESPREDRFHTVPRDAGPLHASCVPFSRVVKVDPDLVAVGNAGGDGLRGDGAKGMPKIIGEQTSIGLDDLCFDV